MRTIAGGGLVAAIPSVGKVLEGAIPCVQAHDAACAVHRSGKELDPALEAGQPSVRAHLAGQSLAVVGTQLPDRHAAEQELFILALQHEVAVGDVHILASAALRAEACVAAQPQAGLQRTVEQTQTIP
ncbi:hypothetical protein R1H25_01905 [Stenotrophomonas sp. C2852]|uniref:hypothetical protein n=1 Tax=Stenotrophomonas sp. C2852 TaxID=3077845 RepID=UPI00293C8767|nr:hypothetical protein [Stenotrophomonas sp. C2852]MDV3434199.1 hypothetical protein [Stenotrophomonas sp. C2852]